jgi:hypothetical protein
MTERNAGRRYQKGSDRPAAKLTNEQIIEIRTAVAHGSKQVDVAADYGISQSLVSGIVNGRRWKHVDGPIRMTTTNPEEQD